KLNETGLASIGSAAHTRASTPAGRRKREMARSASSEGPRTFGVYGLSSARPARDRSPSAATTAAARRDRRMGGLERAVLGGNRAVHLVCGMWPVISR